MISDLEFLEVYAKPYHGMKNPNLYVEFAVPSSGGTAGTPMGLLLALTYST